MDEIEAWLDEIQESIRTSIMPKERIEHTNKLLALVRCYREAIKVYSEDGFWDFGKARKEGSVVAPAAELKAKEIIK